MIEKTYYELNQGLSTKELIGKDLQAFIDGTVCCEPACKLDVDTAVTLVDLAYEVAKKCGFSPIDIELTTMVEHEEGQWKELYIEVGIEADHEESAEMLWHYTNALFTQYPSWPWMGENREFYMYQITVAIRRCREYKNMTN